EAGVDEDPLLPHLDQVDRDREADLLLHLFAAPPDPGGRGEGSPVEHRHLHAIGCANAAAKPAATRAPSGGAATVRVRRPGRSAIVRSRKEQHSRSAATISSSERRSSALGRKTRTWRSPSARLSNRSSAPIRDRATRRSRSWSSGSAHLAPDET